MKKKKIMIILLVLIAFISIGVYSINLDNDVEVAPDTDLTYYLDVNYDGIDVKGVESHDGTKIDVKSGIIYVEDKIPEGLTFKNFVETEDGTIGAVSRKDADTPCLGQVIGGVEGLNYDKDTNTVSFKVKDLQAGCKLTVGIVTTTPETVDDTSTVQVERRRDFYNTATATEEDYTATSDTVHVYMGREDEELYSVVYQYEGHVPASVPKLPSTSKYISGLTVAVANNPTLQGYSFSGWKTEDVVVTDGKFSMPKKEVVLKGSFEELPKYKVNYSIDGTIPETYVLPKSKEYSENEIINVDVLKEGDRIGNYRFLGWETKDVTVDDSTFTMPNHNVNFVGKFEEVLYSVTYKFQGENIPDNASELLSPTKSYHPGDIVKREAEPQTSGYKFLGWYKEREFTMPEEDVVIYGEWMIEAGSFEPRIVKSITDKKETYKSGDIVTYEIKVTNTAAYPIKEVAIRENKVGSRFIEGNGYEVLTDNLVKIARMEANQTVTIKAEYKVTNNDSGTIINEAEIISALADNNYHLNKDKEYKATAEFKVFKKNPIIPNTLDNILKYVIIFVVTFITVIVSIILYQSYCKKLT